MAIRDGAGRRIHRFLRSPRRALLLLAFVSVWMTLGTAGWEAAYSHPVFCGALVWLAASTAVCAWERTGRAAATLRARGTVTSAQLDRLRASGPLALTPAEESVSSRMPERVPTALRALGLRVREGPRLVEASSGAWALLASPAFHWSLVALLVLVPLGRLTRSEGMMGIVEGATRIDATESYGQLDSSPLGRPLSGLTIGVEPGMQLSFLESGIDRGAAPTVTVTATNGTQLARQRVYPNHPLRHGSLTIHMDDFGLGVLYSLEDTAGTALRGQATMDFADDAREVPLPFVTSFEDAAGATVATLTIAPTAREATDSATARRVVVRFERPGARVAESTAGQGDVVDVGDGLRLRIEHLGYYARLSVVNDWSVPSMYLLLVLALLSVSVSVLVPYRVVHVLFDGSGQRPVLRVTTRHSRGSPEFAERVRQALSPEEIA